MEVARDSWSITSSNAVKPPSQADWHRLCEQLDVLDRNDEKTVARAILGLAHLGQDGLHAVARWGRGSKLVAKFLAAFDKIDCSKSDYRDVFAMIATPSATSVHVGRSAPHAASRSAGSQVLQFAKPGDLRTATIKKTEHVIEPWIPRGVATLMGAHGGVGKTNLALLMAALLASGEALGSLGCHFAGHQFRPCRVLFVSLEDSLDVIRWRLRNIVDEYNLDGALVDRNLDLLDGTECDPTLAVEVVVSGVTRLAFTPRMDQVAQQTPVGGLVIVDNDADAGAFNQNDPLLVKQYIRGFARIAREKNAGALLLHHIDKAAARYGSAGESYTGAKEWNNTPRSRLSLIANDGVIELRHEKANLGPKAKAVALRFTVAGVLVPVDRDDEATAGEDTQLIACIRAALSRKESINTSRSGPGSAHAAAKSMPGFPAELRRADRFWETINRLEETGVLVRESYTNSNYKLRERFVLSANPPVSANGITSGIHESAGIGPPIRRFPRGGVEPEVRTKPAAELAEAA